MKIHDCEQRTDEWMELRTGRVTGTRIKEMVTGKMVAFETLCKKISAEKMTGISCEKRFNISDAMQHGIDTEDEARSELELNMMSRIKEVGFISKDDLFGVSPDGIIESEIGMVGVEIKCPQPHTHIGYMISPDTAWMTYRWQIQAGLWVSGFRSWIFASYCPTFEDGKKLIWSQIKPVSEDQAKIQLKADNLRHRVDEILESVA